MSYRILTASLVLAVLPALAAAQTSTPQATAPATPTASAHPVPQPAPASAPAFVDRGRTAYYQPPVAGHPATPAVASTAPVQPAPQPTVAGPGARALRMAGAALPPSPVPPTSLAPVAAPVVTAAPSPVPPAVAQPATGDPAAPAAEPSGMVLADYRQGMLTLVADRAPLKKVMALIASKTGATIDVAPELWSELVVAKLGPATANEIVSTLLDGPKIDYFILGSNTQGGIQRVVVRRKQGFGRQPMAMAAAARPAENTANQAPGEAAQEQAQAQTPSDESTPAQDGPPPAR